MHIKPTLKLEFTRDSYGYTVEQANTLKKLIDLAVELSPTKAREALSEQLRETSEYLAREICDLAPCDACGVYLPKSDYQENNGCCFDCAAAGKENDSLFRRRSA